MSKISRSTPSGATSQPALSNHPKKGYDDDNSPSSSQRFRKRDNIFAFFRSPNQASKAKNTGTTSPSPLSKEPRLPALRCLLIVFLLLVPLGVLTLTRRPPPPPSRALPPMFASQLSTPQGLMASIMRLLLPPSRALPALFTPRLC